MKAIILLFIKSSSVALYFVAFVYSLFHSRYYLSFVFSNKVSCKGVFFKNCKIVLSGKNSQITITPKALIQNTLITLVGDETQLVIKGERTVIKNANIHLLDKGSTITIGKSFTIEGGWIMSTEGKDISIGEDCMFSSDIEITNGDFHPIFYQESPNQIINKGKSVHISDHVWLGSHVRVLKGVTLAPHTVIGNSSVVSKSLLQSNSVYAGAPAQLIRTGIDWAREHEKLL